MYGSDTVGVNNSRFNVPTTASYMPSMYGQQTTGVPQVSPVMPPFLQAAGAQSSAGGMFEGVNGYGTAGNNNAVTAAAAANPHSLRLSPVWWAVIALVVGLWLLNVVHWREVIDETVSLGPARESAGESAGG